MSPTIEIFGLLIRETTTAATDYLITCVAWTFGAKLLFSSQHRSHRSRQLFGVSFGFIGLAALCGGTTHGFVLFLDDAVLGLLWKCTVYSIGSSMLFGVAATLIGSPLQRPPRLVAHTLNAAGFAVYAAWMVNHNEFVYVIYHYVLAMLSIAGIQAWAYYKLRAASAPWIVAGVIATLLGAVVQQSGLRLHPHFNHNDLYHVIQIAGLYLLNRGIRVLEDNTTD